MATGNEQTKGCEVGGPSPGSSPQTLGLWVLMAAAPRPTPAPADPCGGCSQGSPACSWGVWGKHQAPTVCHSRWDQQGAQEDEHCLHGCCERGERRVSAPRCLREGTGKKPGSRGELQTLWGKNRFIIFNINLPRDKKKKRGWIYSYPSLLKHSSLNPSVFRRS